MKIISITPDMDTVQDRVVNNISGPEFHIPVCDFTIVFRHYLIYQKTIKVYPSLTYWKYLGVFRYFEFVDKLGNTLPIGDCKRLTKYCETHLSRSVIKNKK